MKARMPSSKAGSWNDGWGGCGSSVMTLILDYISDDPHEYSSRWFQSMKGKAGSWNDARAAAFSIPLVRYT
jgi:hypothetical protein